MKLSVVGSLLAFLVLAAAFVTGCATAPPVDWGSRVGHYTYAQAVHELGPPNRQIRMSNGATEFKWFLQPATDGAGMNRTGINYNGMNNAFGPGNSDRYLQLTFDRNGVLTAWSRN